MDNDHVYTTVKGIDNSISTSQSRLLDGLTEIRNILHDNQLKHLENHLKMIRYILGIERIVTDNTQTLSSISEQLTAIERKLDKISIPLSQN